ncbi:MAG: 16S rRNA (cytosine(1402)-N(4))-methyltransferase RsmH [Candidatus Brocadiaceae bacterium]|nr:16S rRNA (cytosine(1402)-N(4))-methyltransferase RsmH [Candidatus Brocadiaceae bacterium]
MNDTVKTVLHTPVMVREVLDILCLHAGQIILDCTVGSGGHANKILCQINPGGLLIGIDRDSEILHEAKQCLSKTENNFRLYHANYCDIDEVLRQAAVEKVDGILLDLGASSLQFDQAVRGFSFSKEGQLDMRMDRSQDMTAQILIDRLSERNLEKLLKQYGEERWARRIARAIYRERQKGRITSTRELAGIIERVVPSGRSKIHPATRVFQALRIAVNKELECLEIFLGKIHNYMAVGARIVIISFHSLEDRIVKNEFTRKSGQDIFRILTKKPITPSNDEIRINVRCRSAKLRAAERI